MFLSTHLTKIDKITWAWRLAVSSPRDHILPAKVPFSTCSSHFSIWNQEEHGLKINLNRERNAFNSCLYHFFQPGWQNKMHPPHPPWHTHIQDPVFHSILLFHFQPGTKSRRTWSLKTNIVWMSCCDSQNDLHYKKKIQPVFSCGDVIFREYYLCALRWNLNFIYDSMRLESMLPCAHEKNWQARSRTTQY